MKWHERPPCAALWARYERPYLVRARVRVRIRANQLTLTLARVGEVRAAVLAQVEAAPG